MIAAALNGLLCAEDFKRDYEKSSLSILMGDIIADLPISIVKILKGSFRKKSEKEISSSGYVINSLEAALWGIANSDSFEEGVRKVVNLGNDADTVGAIYGQLAGIFTGYRSMDTGGFSYRPSKPDLLDEISKGLTEAPWGLNLGVKAKENKIERFKESLRVTNHEIPSRCW